jgi:hypothetical protein
MTFKSRFLPLLALPLATAAISAPAFAQQPAGSCPPGSWFCADAQGSASTSGAASGQAVGSTGQLQPLPGPNNQAAQPAGTPPPVVVYQPPPPVVVYQQPREAPPPYEYTPRPPDWQRKREWGLNLHLAGATFGRGRNGDSGMGGLGLGLRYKPNPHLGFEGDLDFYGGRDYNGFRRGETSFSLNALIFVNPQNKTQVYFLGGFGWSFAKAVDDTYGYDEASHKYAYFGGQLGVGVEFRLSKTVALNVDVRGFIRGRTDSNAKVDPEFRDAMGRTTNTSGGGLLTGGLTFYF